MMKRAPEVICLGMSVVDVLVKGVGDVRMEGATYMVEDVAFLPGGDAVNEAITLANLGHRVALMTNVGDDEQGTMILRACDALGIDARGISVSQRYPTATSIVLIGMNGEHGFLSRPNHASAFYALEDINLDLIGEGTKVLSIGSLFCSKLLNDPELTAILKKAKEIGAVTIADLVLDRADSSLSEISTALKCLDYIVPSIDEARHFSGKSDCSDIADAFMVYGVRGVVIKLGAKGVYAKRGAEEYTLPTFASRVVDTTGAGDNFMAGFISGLMRGCSLEECLRFGSGTAAISIGKVGATGAIHSLEQVQDFINMDKEVNAQ